MTDTPPTILLKYTMTGVLANTNPPFQPTYWTSFNTPDFTATFSNYPLSAFVAGTIAICQGSPVQINSSDNDSNIPIGPAGGDLSGTYPDPTVVGLQGNAISPTEPTTGQVLTWDGLRWIPLTVSGTVTLSGDVTGTVSSNILAKIDGHTVTAPSPSTNQVLQYNGSAWVPATVGSAPTGAAGGDLSGSYPNPTVATSGGQPIVTDATTLGGDLAGNMPNPSVAKIHGVAVNALPSANQVLVATAGTTSTWEQVSNAQVSPTAAIAGTKISPDFGSQNVATTGTLSAGATTVDTLNAGATVVSSLQDTVLGVGVLHSDETGNVSSSLVVDADVSNSANIAVSKLATGTSGQILQVNNSVIPAWNTMSGDAVIDNGGVVTVEGLQGNPVSAATPSVDDVLTFNGSAWAPAAGGGGGSVTWADDLVGSTNTDQFVASLSGPAGAGGIIPINATTLQFGPGQTSPAMDQTAKVSTTGSPSDGQTLSIVSQNGQATTQSDTSGGAGGKLVLASGSGGTGSPNGPAGDILLQAGTTQLIDISGSVLGSVTFAAGAAHSIAPFVTQTQEASTSATSGESGTTMFFLAQPGQPATGASHNGGTGGAIELSSGYGGSSGSASPGIAGNVYLSTGEVTQVTISPTQTTMAQLAGFGDGYVGVSNAGVLRWTSGTSGGGGGGVTWANDLAGSSATHQYVIGISGSAGAGGTVTLGDGTHNLSLIQDTSVQSTPPNLEIDASTGYAAANTSGAGGSLTLTSGTADVATSGSAVGGAGGGLNVSAGSGAPGLGGSNAGGAGGTIVLTSGNGGSSPGGTGGNAGNITLDVGGGGTGGGGNGSIGNIQLQAVNTEIITISGSSMGSVTFGNNASITPVFSQTARALTSSSSPATGAALSITAQAGQATSASHAGGVGGELILSSGAGGAGTPNAAAGIISLQIGGTEQLGISNAGAVKIEQLGGSGDGYVTVHNDGTLFWSATPAGGGGSGITALTNDVTATGPGSAAATVAKINGATVPASGSLTTGNTLGVTGSSALGYSALNLAGGSGYVTGALPVANLAHGTAAQVLMSNNTPATAWTTISQDVTLGSTGTATVVGIRDTTLASSISSVGAAQDGYALTWVNANSDWEAKPQTGGGGGGITALTGDVTASGSGSVAATCVSITGGAGVVNVSSSGNIITWNSATTAPGITETAKASTSSGSGSSGAIMTIRSQAGQAATGASNNGGNGGVLILGSGAGGTSGSATPGTDGTVEIKTGATVQAAFFSTLTSFASALNFANYGTGILHSDSSGNITSSAIANGDITPGTSGQVLMTNNTPATAWQSFSQDATLGSAGAVTVVGIRDTALASSISSVGATQDGYVLTWVNGSSNWQAKIAPGGTGNISALTGDVTASGSGSVAATVATMQATNTVTKTGNYTINSGSPLDFQIFANPSGAFNLTLPAPANGMVFHVWDISGTMETNNVTLVRHGSEKISGVAASRALATNWGHWMITTNGTDWFVG